MGLRIAFVKIQSKWRFVRSAQWGDFSRTGRLGLVYDERFCGLPKRYD
jgi:hypothetical protein